MKFTFAYDVSPEDWMLPIFAQGADAVVEDEECRAGLWWTDTPVFRGERLGSVGACEFAAPGAAEFLNKCTEYLHREQGRAWVVGPMNGNTWRKHRLILESDGRAPFLMEPYEAPELLQVFIDAGFEMLSSYSSSVVELSKDLPDFSRLEKRLAYQGVEVRSLDIGQFEAELQSIYRLSLESFANNFLYVPLSEEAFVGGYLDARDSVDEELVLMAEVDGELVAYLFCMPDLLALKAGRRPALIVKTLASKNERGLAGIGTYLVGEAQRRAKAKGYDEAIHALQHEDNSSLRITQRFDARVFRRYGLMVHSQSAL